METVQLRFESFKRFIRNNVKDPSPQIGEFYKIELSSFLTLIKFKKLNGVNVDTCLDEIFEQTGMQKSDYGDAEICKLKEYMHYFSDIVDLI